MTIGRSTARFFLQALLATTGLVGCGRVVIGDAPDSGTPLDSASGSGSGGASGSGSGGSPSSGSGTGAPNSGSGTGVTTIVERKVDLLFDIDNSASMGDKQAYLIEAIPDLVARLVTPRCVDASGAPTGANADATSGTCASGSTPEFAPVRDLHIGVVTSSLGSRLGVSSGSAFVCDPAATVTTTSGAVISAYNDDQGHLINRTGPLGAGAALAEATLPEGGGFLNWLPGGNSQTNPPQPLTAVGTPTTPGTLIGDFTELVSGVGESGCGIESQLESWYRFLIQPDPYATLVNNNGVATWSGVDTTILQQRHDFLRPDSLVAVIVLTDENDSEIDVRSYQGSGYLFMRNTFNPPKGSSQCVTNPNDPGCTSTNVSYTSGSDSNDWGFNLNLRHVHMPQKYGLNPQYPLTRYSNGLSSPTVPNRNGEYPSSKAAYAGTNNCTNPLFAASLPSASDVPDATAQTPSEIDTTLCKLPAGTTRAPGDVFFAHIGGVPHQLLQSTPGDGTCPAGTAAADCPQKSTLAAGDWVRILGKGPSAYTAAGGTMSYDYTGIDPHMIEAMNPRNQASLPNSEPIPAVDTSGTNPVVGTAFGNGADPVRPDPVNGREWTTNTGTHSLPVDREYACIFQLPVSQQRDCAAVAANTVEGNSCDCVPGGAWGSGGSGAPTGNTNDQVPPLCSKTSSDGTSITSAVNDYTVQTYAKAYPTIRELMLANMMGSQGVVSSLCPIHTTDNATGDDPLYGYRPAMNTLVDRLKNAMAK